MLKIFDIPDTVFRAVYDGPSGIVKFFDVRFGQHISEYDVSTLLGVDGGVVLYGDDDPEWVLSEQSVEAVKDWLKSLKIQNFFMWGE